MKVLFDQGVPVPLRRYLLEHTIDTAYEKGWSALSNGVLLSAAEQAGYEVLVTTDQNLQYQQNLHLRRLAILVLSSTSWPQIRLRTDDIRRTVDTMQAGEYRKILI
jgi:hypothetical protein